MQVQLTEISVDYIVEFLEFELKEPSFLCYYNLIQQDKTFRMACQSFLFYFTYKTGFKQTDFGMFVEVILQRL